MFGICLNEVMGVGWRFMCVTKCVFVYVCVCVCVDR